MKGADDVRPYQRVGFGYCQLQLFDLVIIGGQGIGMFSHFCGMAIIIVGILGGGDDECQ